MENGINRDGLGVLTSLFLRPRTFGALTHFESQHFCGMGSYVWEFATVCCYLFKVYRKLRALFWFMMDFGQTRSVSTSVLVAKLPFYLRLLCCRQTYVIYLIGNVLNQAQNLHQERNSASDENFFLLFFTQHFFHIIYFYLFYSFRLNQNVISTFLVKINLSFWTTIVWFLSFIYPKIFHCIKN